MKITDVIIIFFIISIPFFFYAEAKSENTTTFALQNQHHEGAVTIAAHDAITTLSTNIVPKLDRGYDDYKYSPVDPSLAYETFMNTLAANYQVETDNSKEILSTYVPVFAVLDYDGLLLNVYQQHKGPDGEQIFERVWLPKIPFSYADDMGNIINFTVSDDVEIYDRVLNEWFTGKRADLAADDEISIPLLADEDAFEKIRRQKIVSTMQEQFAYYVNEHNVYAKYLDMTYKFVMPMIEEDDWYNTVDDVSIFAFFQGYQYKMDDQPYNEFAFVGSRYKKTDRIMAGTVQGERRFWQESCDFPYTADEIYSTEKHAAAAGYREISCLNPL